MTSTAKLVEQHVAEYESRLKHMDELTQRAADTTDQELDSELQELISERDRLANHVEQMKLHSVEDWDKEMISLAGPMAIWDSLAQNLEKLVERLER